MFGQTSWCGASGDVIASPGLSRPAADKPANDRALIVGAIVIALTVTPGATLDSRQGPGAALLPGALADVELTTPIRVAEVRGTVYSSRRQPLEEADFVLEQGNGWSVGVFTDVKGSFEWLTFRNRKIAQGTYRFRARPGPHSVDSLPSPPRRVPFREPLKWKNRQKPANGRKRRRRLEDAKSLPLREISWKLL